MSFIVPAAGVRAEAPDAGHKQPAETRGWRLNHTCYRIRDPAISLPFYQNGLGLRLFFVFNAGAFTVYYLGYPSGDNESVEVEDVRTMQQREGLLELVYSSGGNVPAHGAFGHIGITVPSVEQAVERLRVFGATVVKSLGSAEEPSLPQGHGPLPVGFARVLRKIAFVQDPDGHWIEIVPLQIHAE